MAATAAEAARRRMRRGCGRRLGVQTHYVIHWAHGGRTDLDKAHGPRLVRVRVLSATQVNVEGKAYGPVETVEIPDDEATLLIAAWYAEKVAAKAKTPEK